MAGALLPGTYVPPMSDAEVAQRYLNSRFPFKTADTEQEAFRRINVLLGCNSCPYADYKHWRETGTLPEYIADWVTTARSDYLHRVVPM